MIYFLIYLFLEVIISVNVFGALGGIWAFIEIIFSAVLGIILLANARYTMAESFNALATHRISHEIFSKVNMFGFIGAILLIIPGILTDGIGILLQFSAITSLVLGRFVAPKPPRNSHQDQDVIDVEIIESKVSDPKEKNE